jgi:hypothetical protein
MTKVIFPIIIIALLSISTVAYGAEWELISIDTDDMSIYVDTQNTSRISDNIIRAWIKTLVVDNSNPLYIIDYTEFDCRENKSRVLQTTAYFKSGNTLTQKEPAQWAYQLHGSVDSMYRLFAS